jgi:hypothetical protein
MGSRRRQSCQRRSELGHEVFAAWPIEMEYRSTGDGLEYLHWRAAKHGPLGVTALPCWFCVRLLLSQPHRPCLCASWAEQLAWRPLWSSTKLPEV